jgi:hypothetical protein
VRYFRHVTKVGAAAEQRRCEWCGRPFEVNATGRPRTYCRSSCRQRDYEARKRAHDVGLSESELIVARSKLDELHDALYVLEAAIEDVDRDLAAADEPEAYKEALLWLLDAARPIVRGTALGTRGGAK